MGLAIKCDKCGVFETSPVWAVEVSKRKDVGEVSVFYKKPKELWFCEKCGKKMFGKLLDDKEEHIIDTATITAKEDIKVTLTD